MGLKQSPIKQQITDPLQPEEKTKASFMLFTGEIPEMKQRRNIENKGWAKCSEQTQSKRSRIGSIHIWQIRNSRFESIKKNGQFIPL